MRVALVRGPLPGLCPFRLITACTVGGNIDVVTIPDTSWPTDADLVLVDWTDTQKSLHYIQHLRDTAPLATVILVTSAADMELMRWALQLRIAAVVPAPVEDSVFQEAFTHAVSLQRRLTQQYVPVQQLEEAHKALQQLCQNRFITDLFANCVPQDMTNAQIAAHYSLTLTGDRFFAICMALDPAVDDPSAVVAPPEDMTQYQAITRDFASRVTAWAASQPVDLICCDSPYLVSCVVQYRQLDVAAFCQTMTDTLQAHYAGVRVLTMGCSATVLRLAQLSSALDQARNQVRSRIFLGTGGVLAPGEPDSKDSSSSQYFTFERIIRLHTSASIGSTEAAQVVLNAVLTDLAAAPVPSAVFFDVLDLLCSLVFQAVTRNAHARSQVYSFTLEFWSLVDSCSSLPILRRRLAAWLHRQLGKSAERPVVPPAIDICLRYINDNLSSDLSLGQAAELAGLSPAYLSALFRRCVGWTFTQYVQSLRLTTATALLQDTDLSVAQITHAVGFTDYRYFTRLFARDLGMSPTQYRKSIQTR